MLRKRKGVSEKGRNEEGNTEGRKGGRKKRLRQGRPEEQG